MRKVRIGSTYAHYDDEFTGELEWMGVVVGEAPRPTDEAERRYRVVMLFDDAAEPDEDGNVETILEGFLSRFCERVTR